MDGDAGLRPAGRASRGSSSPSGFARCFAPRSAAEHFEQNAPLRGRRVAELVRGQHLGRGLVRRAVVARVHLGQRLARPDRVAALAQADDADRVVDRVVLRPPARAEVERGVADRDRAEARDVPGRGAVDRAHDRSASAARPRRVAALRLDPAARRRDGGAVRDRRLGARAPFGLVDRRGRTARAAARTRRARAR